jgi:hypothetical protein
MPPLDCPVRERFAQEYVQSNNAAEAYKKANPKAVKWKPETLYPKASKVLAENKVRTRLIELQEASAAKAGITIESITQMLKEDRELARSSNQSSAAIQAAMGLAKLHGLILDKQSADVRTSGTVSVTWSDDKD